MGFYFLFINFFSTPCFVVRWIEISLTVIVIGVFFLFLLRFLFRFRFQDTDIHITLEDQQKINRFARQNARYEELKDDLKVKKV